MNVFVMTLFGFFTGAALVAWFVWRREKSEIVGLNSREAAWCVVSLNHYAMTLRLTCKSEPRKPSKEDEQTLGAAGECTMIMHAIKDKLPPPPKEKPVYSVLEKMDEQLPLDHFGEDGK